MLSGGTVLPNFDLNPRLELLQQNARLTLVIVEPYRSGDTFEAGVVQGVQEETLPQRVAVPEVVHSLIPSEVLDLVGDVLDGQGNRPYSVVGVAVETGVLDASA